MAAPLDPPTAAPDATGARRDAGLSRIRHLTRWLATGAVALTSVFAGLAAHATSNTTGDTASGAIPQPDAATTRYSDDDGYGYDDEDEDSYDEDHHAAATPQPAPQAPQPTQSAPSASSGAS